jgi:hypothetical protein
MGLAKQDTNTGQLSSEGSKGTKRIKASQQQPNSSRHDKAGLGITAMGLEIPKIIRFRSNLYMAWYMVWYVRRVTNIRVLHCTTLRSASCHEFEKEADERRQTTNTEDRQGQDDGRDVTHILCSHHHPSCTAFMGFKISKI